MNDISYNINSATTDAGLMATIGKFVQYHRLSKNRSQSNVATAAGISRSTLSLLERGEKIALGSLIKVLRTLDLLHVLDVFKVSNELSPIQYAKLQKEKRQRTRSKGKRAIDPKDSEW